MKPLLFFLFVFFFSCGKNQTADADVIARVNDEVLTKRDLVSLVGEKTNSSDLYERTTRDWVERKLLYGAALSAGLNKDLLLVKERDLFYQNLLISHFIKLNTKKGTSVKKEEVSDYYLKNKESFKRTDAEALVKHFVFSTKKEAEKAKKELIKEKTKEDVKSFLAEQRVETKIIKKGEAGSNLVGYVFSGDVGDFIGPKKHKKNYHLFQVLQKYSVGSYRGLELVFDEIYQRISKEKEISSLERLVDSLYLASDVFVSGEFIE